MGDANREGGESSEACAPWRSLTLQKNVAPNTPIDNNDAKYAVPGVFNFTKAEVLAATTDVMGNALLGIHGHAARPNEPTLDEVAAAIPPLRSINGARVWVANRESGVDCTFDASGANFGQGTPSPSLVSSALPGCANPQFDHEGIVGALPILLLDFPVLPGNGSDSDVLLWEMTTVPVANGTGYEQPVFIRFVAVNRTSARGISRPSALYFNTFAYVPSMCASDVLAGCDAPGDFFSAMLDVHFYWDTTWKREGTMSVGRLPTAGGVDGGLLSRHAQHALVLDMITRNSVWFPRYGTYPGYEQPGVGADGFQEIFTASMMAALEWGNFDFATGVLENWLRYFVGKNGFVLYRGVEMAQQGRMLTMFAQHYRYTHNPALLIKYIDKVQGVGGMLLDRRNRALGAFPANDSRHGMPTGNDEADLFWTTIKGHPDTELPYISIAAEMWRGLRDCGAALQAIATADPSQTQAAEVGRAFSAAAPALLDDLRQSMQRDAIQGNGTVCHPYVAGIPECGFLPHASSNRASEPWRTYAEALYSGAIDPQRMREILEWHQLEQGSGVKGSRLKLGVLSGCGGDVSCGDSLETFTIHGFGYGLLQADLIEPFLLQYYALVAHAYTRGTFIAPESTPIDRTHASPSFATPAGLTSPIFFKWLFVYEEPMNHTLWIGKAIPRPWLAEGEVIDLQEIPTAYGRLSVRIESRVQSTKAVHINVSATALLDGPRSPHQRFPQTLVLRLRVPESLPMSSVTLGGRPWTEFNASCECVSIPGDRLADLGAALQDVVVGY